MDRIVSAMTPVDQLSELYEFKFLIFGGSRNKVTIFETESPLLFWVQFGCSQNGNNGFIGRGGRKPPDFVE